MTEAQRSSPLDAVLRRGGATMVTEDGVTFPLDFGSPAGEVAICLRAVGIADRSELVKLELRGPHAALATVLGGLAQPAPDTGEVATTEFGWVCVTGAEHALLLVEPPEAREVAARVTRLEGEHPEVSHVEASRDFAAIAVVGPSAESLLAAAGPPDGSAVPSPGGLAAVQLAYRPAFVLRIAEHEFLAVVGAAHAEATWHALHDAGEGFGVGSVGHAALGRFEISARLAIRQGAH